MHGRRAGLAAVVVLIASASLRTWQPPELPADIPPPAPGVLAVGDPPGNIEELRERIAAILARNHVPGAAIGLVDRNGPVWVGGVGVRDVTTNAPTDGDTVFRVGSLSKSIIALGVMRLVDQGKLDLDRPLREILPGLIDNPWEAEAPVTLAHLMEHTAGLDDVRFNEVFTDDEGLSVSDALALNPRTRVVRWRPGSRHAYANGGYTIVARAIEVATGEPFDVYLRREVLRPLGIRDAEFRRTDVLAPRLATGYVEPGKAAAFYPFAHRPSASLLISATELAKVVHFWIRRGEGYPPIVSRAGLARIERSGTLPYAKLATDYGFANYGDVSHPVFARGHDGGMPGFHASMRYFPELGVGYVMLLNSVYAFRGYFEIRALLFSYLTRGRTFAPPVVATGSERPGSDYFAFASPRNNVFAFVDRVRYGWRALDRGDTLHIEELQGDSSEFVPTDDGGFRATTECGSSVRFTTNHDGAPVMVMSFLYAEGDSYLLGRARYVALDVAMFFVKLAPIWAVVVLLATVLGMRPRIPLGMLVWPTIASLSASAFMPLLFMSFDHGAIGVVHPLTVALLAMSIVFPVASFASLYCAIRWSFADRTKPRLRWRFRVLPMTIAIALSGLALWFVANGLFAFRTWAW